VRCSTLAQKQKLDRKPDRKTWVDRREFDQIVKTSILESVRMIGDDYLDLFLSFLQRKNGIRDFDLDDVDAALDSVFSRFSIAVKHVIMFQICATLKIEPQKLLKSLEWTIQEIRSSCW
jgi:hypothetical protein